LLALVVGVWSLTVGSAGIGVPEVMSALGGSAPAGQTRIVVEWRLPRVVLALLGGAALTVSGAVFQSVTRNPLGSPDLIGFSAGASTGALLAGLVAAGSTMGTSLGALAGALLTGLAVYLLAVKQGIAASRILIVGIALSMFLSAFNTWLLTTMRLEQAISAASWGAGSLADIGWWHTVPVAIGLLVALPIVLWFAADMRMLEMGDDAGRGVGVRAEPVRLILLGSGVLLVALAGTVSIDRKRARKLGPSWQSFVARTSNLPFAAILRGRNHLALAEIGIAKPALALLIFAVVIGLHPILFHASPLPW